MSQELEKLYGEMSQLTAPVCAKECRVPHSCCDRMYCEIAEHHAKENGVTLVRTDHPTLLFMSASGCTVPPHLRPICTVHVCCINSLGVKPNDPKWTEKYFKLRDRIEELEYIELDPAIEGVTR